MRRRRLRRREVRCAQPRWVSLRGPEMCTVRRSCEGRNGDLSRVEHAARQRTHCRQVVDPTLVRDARVENGRAPISRTASPVGFWLMSWKDGATR
jgi:hypothetical protein